MNGKERLMNIFQGKPADRVSWTTICDDITRSIMSPEYKDIPLNEFYQKIGCDILQFGLYGLPEDARPVEYEIVNGVNESHSETSDGTYVRTRTFNGKSLSEKHKNGHPLKYPVETAEELKVYLEMLESYRIEPQEAGYKERCLRCEAVIGENGIYTPTFQPSPVQQLIEYDCGVEAFYNLLYDETELMERVIDALFTIRRREYETVAKKSPFLAAIAVENTSTAMISPEVYRKYSLNHMSEFVDIMHNHDKKAILHMCGHIYHLLPELKETGLDGIHALTTPEIGDCSFEAALDALGDDLIIIGLLDSGVFQSPYTTEEDIRDCVKKTLTPRLKESNFILAPVADGLPTDEWRFLAVKDAMEEYGKK